MSKILLVGASGFLGAKIKSHYEARGNQVSTMGRDINSTIQVDFERFNIKELELSAYQFDTIIHCAAINETEINKSIYDTYLINVTFTRLLTELAIHLKIHNFIYISTFHVYGGATAYINEKSEVRPLNDYGLTHYLSEKIVENVCSVNNIEYLIVRPTNIYGIPQSLIKFNRWSLVPFLFVKQAVEDSSICLTSTGEQLRNFVSVDDVIASFDCLGKVPVINAYGVDTLSIYEFAKKVAHKAYEVAGIKVDVSRQLASDITSVKKDLNVTNLSEEYMPSENQLDNYLAEIISELKSHG